ncbi:MAG TPA: FAD-dependent oxidoreductase [Bryobacteraceae bacterium]|nr:FAD-dependent oxidoreductase [Bryobacteraceae bacterium]
MNQPATEDESTVAGDSRTREVVIVGGGLAGLSAAIYLGRAKRDTLVIDSGKSMARWEPDVQNYLGFPDGISGEELLARGCAQARAHEVEFATDEIVDARRAEDTFVLRSRERAYRSRRVLIATGIFHVPPEINGVAECLGHSMFFCKDCDGYRVQDKAVVIYGWTNETVEYALAMLAYTPIVAIVTDGREPRWDQTHHRWIQEYELPVFTSTILEACHEGCAIRCLRLSNGDEVEVDALFTTRGDICYNELARSLDAELDPDGQIRVNANMATSVPGLYAAGCVTPANCQMLISAGDGAVAAQAINRDLFEESLKTHHLRRLRRQQLATEETIPTVR